MRLLVFLARPKETVMPKTSAPAEATAPVLMRFLTQGGAVVEVRRERKRDRVVHPYLCLGCDYEFDNYSSVVDARHEANAHAEKCRAMPKPGGAS